MKWILGCCALALSVACINNGTININNNVTIVAEGEACGASARCADGLLCVASICVRGDVETDAGRDAGMSVIDAGEHGTDAGVLDGGASDGGTFDGGALDGGAVTLDGGDDAGAYDGGLADAGDAGEAIGGVDSGLPPFGDLTLILHWFPEANAPCREYSEEACAAMSDEERLALCCGQSDLDLHFVAPGGALGDYGACPSSCDVLDDAGSPTGESYCTEGSDEHVDTCRQLGSDVAFANPFPEWGLPGRADDAHLAVQDVRGDGPEFLTLSRAAAGEYRAVVHYCTDRIGEPTVARLRAYVNGVLVATAGPQLLDVEGEAWQAMLIVRSGTPDDGGFVLTPQLNVFEGDAPADLCTR